MIFVDEITLKLGCKNENYSFIKYKVQDKFCFFAITEMLSVGKNKKKRYNCEIKQKGDVCK